MQEITEANKDSRKKAVAAQVERFKEQNPVSNSKY